MANQKILDRKQCVIDEVSEKVKNSSSLVIFEYQGLTVKETDELRKLLKNADSEFKVYKNTLVNRALKSMNIDLESELNGPKAFAFGKDQVAPIKVLSDYAKTHQALELKVGIVDGEIADINMLNQLATIPSREGLYTMLAAGMIGIIRDLSICLDLYSKEKEN